MLDDDEAARRRELHQRVYAPGGSLTDAEIAELHDLDNRNLIAPEPVVRPEPAEPLAPAEPPLRGAQHAATDPEDAASRDPRADEDSASADPAPEPPVRGAQHAASDPADAASRDLRAERAGTPRRRWLLPVIAVVAVLVGLAFGRFVLGSGADAVAMDAAQQKTWAHLEASDKYTPGSVSLLGSKYGADVWQAHRTETDVECMVLTRADDRAEACGMLDPDQGESNLGATLNYTEDGTSYTVYANLARDILGNPITVLQRYANEEWDWRSMYSEDELATVHVLEAAGFDGESLGIVGYDRDVPVWAYQNERYCLIVVRDGDLAQQCGEPGVGSTQTLALYGGDAQYTLQPSESRGPVLTITRRPDVTKEG